MKQLYFVRHGESEDNAARIWGRLDSPLTQTGRDQAVEAAANIKKQGLAFDLIVTSTLPRAIESATIIARHIGYPTDKIVTNALLIERGWGDLTGVPSAPFYDGTKTLKDLDSVPNAEKLANLQARAAQALAFLKDRPEATILYVGHGSFCRALRRVINGEPPEGEYAPDLVRYQNGEITKLV